MGRHQLGTRKGGSGKKDPLGEGALGPVAAAKGFTGGLSQRGGADPARGPAPSTSACVAEGHRPKSHLMMPGLRTGQSGARVSLVLRTRAPHVQPGRLAA